MAKSQNFIFDGSAATYLGISIFAFLVTALSLGIAYPYALVTVLRWTASHTRVNGHRLAFTGTTRELYRHWALWYPLCIITLGIFAFWLAPRLRRWILDQTDFAGQIL